MKKKKYSMAYKIYSEDTVNKYQKKIDLLGYKDSYSAIIFLNVRLVSSILLFFVLLYFLKYGYIIAPIATFLYFLILPRFVIDKKVEKRAEKLDNEAMYFFEVLTLSLETGRNLKTALEITARNIDSELSDEFKRALDEVKYGKSLNEALDSLKTRIPSDTINNIILNISQSNIFGNSIIETMYNQIDYIRDRQIMRTKARINKIPLKVSVVSVIFFIPLLLLLILSPVIIDYLS
ncbi:type II secretion system F domain protein [Clostridium sp. CAG:710]|nr:type II secretion system F domain protein [Clostridium sp. CAG:710]